MSNEARVTVSLQIRSGKLFYQSLPSAFSADVAGTAGPTPGRIKVPTAGIDVDLSKLTTKGGLCRVMNLDTANFVTYGIKDNVTSKFFALGELLPGETFPLRLSRELGNAYGTGTHIDATGDTWHFRADTALCEVLVEAFDR